MEPESSLPRSPALATCPYLEPDQSSPCLPIPPLEESRVPFTLFTWCQEISPSPGPLELFRNIVSFYGELLTHCQIPNLSTIPCQLSATACSVDSQLPAQRQERSVYYVNIRHQHPALSTAVPNKYKPRNF
jgi:hypothetical protein